MIIVGQITCLGPKKRKEKKNKKLLGGGGRGKDDSDDEDPLAKMERLNREAEAMDAKVEEDEQEDIPQPAKKGKRAEKRRKISLILMWRILTSMMCLLT